MQVSDCQERRNHVPRAKSFGKYILIFLQLSPSTAATSIGLLLLLLLLPSTTTTAAAS